VAGFFFLTRGTISPEFPQSFGKGVPKGLLDPGCPGKVHRESESFFAFRDRRVVKDRKGKSELGQFCGLLPEGGETAAKADDRGRG
jgi:hypothetical protein